MLNRLRLSTGKIYILVRQSCLSILVRLTLIVIVFLHSLPLSQTAILRLQPRLQLHFRQVGFEPILDTARRLSVYHEK